MTYEEFMELAYNPPVKERECVFELTTVTINKLPGRRRQHYPQYGISKDCRSVHHSVKEAENYIRTIISRLTDKAIYCFTLDEIPLQQECNGYWSIVSRRVYNERGKLIDQTLCSAVCEDEAHYRNFRGRPKEFIRFRVGDIVEVPRCDNIVQLAVVVGVPPQPDWMWHQINSFIDDHNLNVEPEEIEIWDISDDSYTVVDGADYMATHEHLPCTALFKPHFAVPPYLQRRLKGYCHKIMNNNNR